MINPQTLLLSLKKQLREKITAEDILHFLQQLTTLIEAGINLMQSLDILAEAHEKTTFRQLILSLCLSLESGKQLSQGLQRFPCHFDLFSCQLLRIGEQTGTLDRMLKRVCHHKEKKLALKQQLQQTLLYPSLILVAALITTLSLLLFVVPHFAHLFEHLPHHVPAFTQGLINLSLSLRQGGIGLVFALLVLLVWFYQKNKDPRFITTCHERLFQLPYLHPILKKILLARFARHLSTALAAAIPLTEALIMVSLLFRLRVFIENIQHLHAGVRSGNRFYATLGLNPFFPPLLVQMVRTGEESGTLEKMLEQFAILYEGDIERLAQRFNQLLPPLIIAILGVLIGGIVIAMYLPIFHLGTVI